MLGRIYACILERVSDEGLVGQGLQGCSGLGNNDEQGTGYVDGLENGCCVIGIDVADESGFHLLLAILFCPILKCQIQCPGTKVAAADTDLHNCGKGLALIVGDLACMYLIGKISRFLLLGDIELSLVDAVINDVVALLSAAELVQNQTLLACVDHCAVVQLFIFLCELCLIRELLKDRENFIINEFRSIVVFESASHGNVILCNALRAIFTGHHFYQVDASLERHQLFVRSQCIQIFPRNHNSFSSFYPKSGGKYVKSLKLL